eukprot:14015523-Ditylum_brightwellii.AAC.1
MIISLFCSDEAKLKQQLDYPSTIAIFLSTQASSISRKISATQQKTSPFCPQQQRKMRRTEHFFGRGIGQGHFKTSSSTSRAGPPHVSSPPMFGLQKEDVTKKNHCDIQNDLVETDLKQQFASPFPSCFIKPVTTFSRLMLVSSSTIRNNQEMLTQLQDPSITKSLGTVNIKVKLMAPQPIADCPTIK